MIKIRNRVFETNSSSSHAIAFAREADYNKHPDCVDFKQGDFGWADEEVSPADYLYTYILINKMGMYECSLSAEELFENEYIKDIIYNLNKFGIKCTFDGLNEDNYWGEIIHVSGYIDHQSQDTLDDLFYDLMSDPHALYNYLFASHVYTGNDNESSEKDNILLRDCGAKTIEIYNWETRASETIENPNYNPDKYIYY